MPASRGAYLRFKRQVREADLRATGDEHADLERLVRLVRCEAIGVLEAQGILSTVIHSQHQRHQMAA